ncbi:MAG: Barrel-sandwich domain of CusB or HlyD rane-fusion [Pseudomonadota bacterium]
MKKLWAAVLVLMLLGGTGLAWRLGQRSRTVRVDRGPVGERILARAAVVPVAGHVHVYAPNDGRVLSVAARAGDSVQSGQTLAELEVAGRTQLIAAAQPGVVLERNVSAGDYVRTAEHGANAPLFVTADAAHTELRIEVEAADSSRLETGLALQVRMPGVTGQGGPAALGRIERLSAQLETRAIGVEDARLRAGGLVRVGYASWDGEKLGWPLGARAEVSIDLGTREAPERLPRDAVSVREGRTVVERPNALGLGSRETPVAVVRVDPVFAEIRGLAFGTEVLVPDGE